MNQAIVIAARSGRAVHVARGGAIEVINTHGTQVVDFWALCQQDLSEHLSMEHTRTAIGRLMPRVGDTLVSNRRQPMLTVIADTSPGIHDTLIASCDAERYRQLGFDGEHDNCLANFQRALADLGLPAPPLPAPLNLFMNVRGPRTDRCGSTRRSAVRVPSSACGRRPTWSSSCPHARKISRPSTAPNSALSTCSSACSARILPDGSHRQVASAWTGQSAPK